MNMQAMLKQAQKMQKDMLETQNKINETEFEAKSGMVSVKMNGKKQILSFNIDAEEIQKDEIELLQDMIMIAINECHNKIDKEIEEKMGVYTKGMPGLF